MSDCSELLDDMVDKWHNGDGVGQELREYIGMSQKEYEKWMQGSGIPPHVCETLKKQKE